MRYLFSVSSDDVELLGELPLPEQAGCEIRLDTFDVPPNPVVLRSRTARPLLATFRSEAHLGRASREARDDQGWALRRSCLEAGFDWIDLELDEPDLEAKIEEVHRFGKRVVLSHHDLEGGESVHSAIASGLETRADIVKVIGTGTQAEDFRIQREWYRKVKPERLVLFYMGEDFAASRVLSLVYGAPFTFLTPGREPAVAPGQLTVTQVRDIFRVEEIELARLRLFAVIGKPIGHSRSPAFHNPLLKKYVSSALFLALPAVSEADLRCYFVTFPELEGLAVTKPMKAVAHEVAGTYEESDAWELGAANTLLAYGDHLTADNTDFGAMKRLIETHVPKGETVRVLGYGGLGKAVVQACLSLGYPVQVTNRSKARLSDLPSAATVVDWENRACPGAYAWVQATSVGMAPDDRACPVEAIPADLRLVVETIYNPRETQLMALARTNGVQVLDGMALFEGQAALQNQLFLRRLIHG
ncbi:3-dehydroquinate dehydratase [Sulfidibacter corallicola]|uniref:Type I 3-dehydroquinate dehydratase n=1 Tax=Sulfidibacter corallicola TaxID=2818388 RepID=A0A8A4TCD1_SULCO|nr:bifunctional type I 3-dehydroquinate dehydratase/shikimate dehydrogenase [Sulfidibacter corallicola]QTD47759.1 type I 3-dehydroquinate dehydratase [Sulfidibacter corallicola]